MSSTAAASPVGIEATPDDDGEPGIYLVFNSNIKKLIFVF